MRRPGGSPFLVLLVIAAGCHSIRPYGYVGHDSNATIVVYRLTDPNLGLAKAFVGVDGQVVVALGNADYTEIQLAPGKHRLSIGADGYLRSEMLEIEVADLERLYFEAEPNPIRWATAAAGVEPVSTVLIAVSDLTATRPFLLAPRSESDFLDRLATLERRDPKAK